MMGHDTSDALIAVTIGVGEAHARLAEIAARRMHHYTGLPTVVLNESDLRHSGLAEPIRLKFRLFDLVNAENILFFDADAFCLAPWDPRHFCNLPEWTAVRGFCFDPRVEWLGHAYGFNADTFNSGFFICNRTHHARVLRFAEGLQPADNNFHGLVNPDEIAFSTALSVLGIPIRFLDRRYNWIQYGRGNLAAQTSTIIAHACDSELRSSYLNGHAFFPGAAQADVDAFGRMGGQTWLLSDGGRDGRPLTFRSDGTIAAVGGENQRYYFSVCREGQSELVIGSVYDVTCTLREEADGTWRGRSTSPQQSAVTLERHRAQVLVDLLTARGLQNQPLVGAEVGVFRGETSNLLLRSLPRLQLYLVDAWRTSVGGAQFWLPKSRGDVARNQRLFDESMRQTAFATGSAAERRHLVPCPSDAAAQFLPDRLDLIFIDAGDHTFDEVCRDLEAWQPKLRPGGLLCGHDYGHPDFPGVKPAVDDFANRHHLTVGTGHDYVWYFDTS
jgi:hypothetical protein